MRSSSCIKIYYGALSVLVGYTLLTSRDLQPGAIREKEDRVGRADRADRANESN